MGIDRLLDGKRLILGVSGGISAYKAVVLLRLLQDAGADVRVIMTRNAQAFVGRVTFEAISGYPVFTEMFSEIPDPEIRHIDWAKGIDAVVIAPATANIIGKIAGGIADDPLSTFLMAVTAPRLVCPAMNTYMYENRALQRNLDILEGDGYTIVDPDQGMLACRTTGPGRLADPQAILERVVHLVTRKDLAGRRVLVSAGPTREPIDPVRFISNPSSGKMGYSLARAAAFRGAEVILVSGPSALPDPLGVKVIRVVTASEMADAVIGESGTADIVIKSAAVSDYRPVEVSEHKVKKEHDTLVMTMERNIDILAELGRRKRPDQVLVGFAAETRDLEKYATEKLARKNLDLIAANIVGEKDSGFEAETNKISFFFPDGRKERLPVMSKFALANLIIDHAAAILFRRTSQPGEQSQ